jgi:hypothetical protein
MQKGFNPFLGKPIYDGGQAGADLFDLTYEEDRHTGGELSYKVPDQLNLPAESFNCEASGMTSEVT